MPSLHEVSFRVEPAGEPPFVSWTQDAQEDETLQQLDQALQQLAAEAPTLRHLLITGWPRPTTVESITGDTVETREERQAKRELPWRTFMLARPEVLVACRGFRDAEDDMDSDDDLPFEDDEDTQAAALRVVQLAASGILVAHQICIS